MLVSPFADNEIVDFDNLTRCLVKLESMFSKFDFTWVWQWGALCSVESLLVSESFQELDQIGTGKVEKDVVEVNVHAEPTNVNWSTLLIN